MTISEAEEYKKKGNDCIKEGKYIEAMLHYTHSIKLDPNNHLTLSNRSLAFLKMQQHYHAWEDSKEVIRLQPNWPKGFFRKGEVEFAAEDYKDAVQTYKQGLAVDPDDIGLRNAYTKATEALRQQTWREWRMPWMGGAIGVIIGLLIVIGDEVLTNSPVIQHMILKILIIVTVGSFGYAIGLGYRYFVQATRASLLDLPIDLFPDEKSSSAPTSAQPEPDQSEPSSRTRQKGGSAAARQRYKKGKS